MQAAVPDGFATMSDSLSDKLTEKGSYKLSHRARMPNDEGSDLEARCRLRRLMAPGGSGFAREEVGL